MNLTLLIIALCLITTSTSTSTFPTTTTTTHKRPPTPITPKPNYGLNFLGSSTFELLNPYRARSTLKFSITGVNVTKVVHQKAGYGWEFSLLNFQEKIRFYRYDDHTHKDHTDFAFHWEMDVEDLDDLPDVVEVCLHYGHNNASWYSTYEERRQSWPMDTAQQTGNDSGAPAFQTGDFSHTGETFGSLIEYLFLNTDGFAVLFSDHEPLRLRRDSNGGRPLLCASIDKKFRFSFKFNILATSNIRTVYSNITSGRTYMRLKKPNSKSLPDEKLFQAPVWSTKVALRSGSALNQSEILDFAQKIKSNALVGSQIVIDDQWEAHLGDLTFDPVKFPNAKVMVDEIHKLGFTVSLWVHPFLNADSSIFKLDNTTSRYLAKDKLGRVLRTKWWKGGEGTSGIVDFSDDSAVGWFVTRLERLKNTTGVDTFTFDAGERVWYGPKVHFADSEIRRHPDLIAQAYATDVAAKFGPSATVRVGYKTQQLPLFVRMLGKELTWGADNGLQTLLPTALTFSLAGYPFILPDMVAGSATSTNTTKTGSNINVTEELYIRWLQATTFLPSMQLSLPPWSFGANSSALKVAKKYIDLHKVHSATIIAEAKKSCTSGGSPPLVRPMWWAEPNDPASFKVADQFMLGDDLLVAPVIGQGQRQRNVYFPTGSWVDEQGKKFKGPGNTKVEALLQVLPYFKRLSSPTSK